MSQRTVADVLVEGLQRAGAQRLFGVPGGGSSLELIEAAGRRGLPFVLCHQETAACIMAAVTGELTGRPGAGLVGLGPGAASAVNGAAYAFLDRAPLVLLTDRHADSHAAFTTHQLLDQQALFRPVTKASLLVAPETADERIAAAVRLALADPRGPVLLELSADVGGRAVAGDACATPVAASSAGQSAETAAATIRAAARPVLLVGLESRTAADAARVRALADRLGAPVLTTYKAKGVVPDDDPLHAGLLTGGAIEEAVIGAADLIVAVGLDVVELIPRPWPYRAPVIHIGRTPVDGGYYRPAIELTGDLEALLDALLECLDGVVHRGWDTRALAQLKRETLARLAVPAEGLAPYRVVQIARELAPAATVVTVDAGAHMFPATTFWTASAPGSFLISNGLATMGFALPAAIAAQLVHPGRRVVCLAGDGGLMMVAAELETVARLALPVVVVVFNDLTLSLIRIKQDQKRYADLGTRYAGPDFCALARSVGFAAFAASTEAELKAAFGEALAAGGPALVDARVDPSGYGPMLDVIRGRSAQAAP